MKKSYQYHDDGRLKFTQDQIVTDSKFDRQYKYDHVARITSALSGAEARGQVPTDDRPYQETMAHDAMGHLTLRELRHWDRYDTTGNETYANNRRVGWQYDPDGRLLSGNSQYTYDAAGQISTFGDADSYETDQQLDGDGQRIKSVQRRYDSELHQWVTEEMTYYIRSSVIGQAVSEVSAQGAKERSFVFDGGNVMAVQLVGLDSSQYVFWKHYDASGASYRSTNSAGESTEAAEIDPLGANAGTTKPFTWPPPTGPGKLEPYYNIPDLNSAFGGCVLDGIPVTCDVLTSENSKRCENDQCRVFSRKQGRVVDYHAYADGEEGYLPVGWLWTGTGFDANGTILTFVDGIPQKPASGEDILPKNLLANIFHLLDDNRCSTFVSNLINVARQLTGKKPYTYDGKELASAVLSQENGGFIFRSGANGGGGAGSAYGDIFSGQATAEIIMFNTAYGPRDPVGVQVSYALTALHEILHLAGGGASISDGSRAYYMDVVLARAAQILTAAPGYPETYNPNMPFWQITAGMTEAAGDYWNKELRGHCTPQEYR
jgi:hypothetical protein